MDYHRLEAVARLSWLSQALTGFHTHSPANALRPASDREREKEGERERQRENERENERERVREKERGPREPA